MSVLDSVQGEWDEDGFHLRLTTTDDERLDVRVTDTKTARVLLEAMKQLREWVAEYDEHLEAYLVASPEERARVLGRALGLDDDDDYLPEDDARERLAVGADLARKREREASS